MINTCKNCTGRHVGCHSICSAYIQAKQIHNETKARIKQAKERDTLFKEYKINQIARTFHY